MDSKAVHPDLHQCSWSLSYWLDVDTRKLHNDCLNVSEPDKTSIGETWWRLPLISMIFGLGLVLTIYYR